MHQRIVCRDEFSVIRDNLSLSINGEKVSPMIQEEHTIKWIYASKITGEHVIELFFNNEKTCEEKFNVY
jgi:hypothetical protein